MPGPQKMGPGSAPFVGNPLAPAVLLCNFPVQGHGSLQCHPGALSFHPHDKTLVDFFGAGPAGTDIHFNAGFPEPGGPPAGNTRIGILHGSHDPRYAGADDRLGTGRRFAEMGAGFKVDVKRRSPRLFTSHVQGLHLGMGQAAGPVVSKTGYTPVPDNDASDFRVRCRHARSPQRKIEGKGHIVPVTGLVHSPRHGWIHLSVAPGSGGPCLC